MPNDESLNPLDKAWVEALADRVSPTDESVLESIYRAYSKIFHTPLHIAKTLPLDEVAKAVYAENILQMDEDSLEESIQRAANPVSDEDEEASIQEFRRKAIEDEHRRKPLIYKKKTSESNDINDLPQQESQSLKKLSASPPEFQTQGSKSYSVPDESPSAGPTGLDSLEQALKGREDR